MTQQDDITQRVLTDDEINDVCDWPAANTTMRAENDRAMAREVEAAVLRKLSKLRAPVADERAAFSRAEISFPLTIPENRVYLAGPMSGIAEHNFPAFHAAADRLRGSGLEVVNPADHGLVEGLGWSDYMRWDLVKLAGCHAVYVLPGWEKSKGASLEIAIARALGMPVFTVEGAALASAPVADDNGAQSTPNRPESRANTESTGGALAPVAGEEQGPIGYVDPVYVAGRQRGMKWNAKVYAVPTEEATAPLYAAPQASAEPRQYTHAEVLGLMDGAMYAALEKAAATLEDHRKAGREWVPGSLWDTLSREAAARIRALKTQADKDGGHQRAGDEQPDFMQSRMTPWGLLVRACRIILGTTLMDMSKALGMPPSDLSAYECDHQRLTDDVILAVMRFFDERGLCIPATAWRKAARASARAALSATQAGQGERQ